jgi:2-keto-4-pentenoate hydratase/2-oxohepta-3-ene-1,7-dioic acid hydratase in catechol pathway
MLFERTVPTVKILGVELPQPQAFFDFLGFEKHVIQIREKRGVQIWPGWYDHATYYIIDLPPEKLFGPGEEVVIPNCVKAPDYEFELACIITKAALIKSEVEALKFFNDHCLITIANDWSARDIQKKDMEGLGPANSKLVIGKSIGPKIVPASKLKMDENGVFDLPMTLRVNGKERCKSNYNSLYHTHPKTGAKQAWSFPRLISFLGQHNIAVQPGYIIGSGSIGNGCIAETMAKMDPNTGEEIEPALYPWLKDADVVELEAEGIGILENKVRVISSEHASKQYAGVK